MTKLEKKDLTVLYELYDFTAKVVYVTVCADCGWEHDQQVYCKSDCIVSWCPECNSDNIRDEERLKS